MVCVPVYVMCEVFFLFFASSSIQPWDLRGGRQEEGAREAQEEEEEDCGVFLKGVEVVGMSEEKDEGEKNGRGTRKSSGISV